VISLFEVKPRRRRLDTDGQFRRAFRVCIHLDCAEQFLAEEKWPDHVAVFDWYSKGATELNRQPTIPVGSRDHNSTITATNVNVVANATASGSPRIPVGYGVPGVSSEISDIVSAGAVGAVNRMEEQPAMDTAIDSVVDNVTWGHWAAASASAAADAASADVITVAQSGLNPDVMSPNPDGSCLTDASPISESTILCPQLNVSS
jgi:hypothetical protein